MCAKDITICRITAGTLNIGDTSTGGITISAPLNLANATKHNDSLVVVRGADGSGKSTLLDHYISGLDDHTYFVAINETCRRLLEEQRLMPREEALPAVRNFLIRMYEDAERYSGL